jgi:hypothetical protein
MSVQGDKRLGDMLDYLPAEEEIVGKHKIGSYDIVATTERVICLRKFPPLFVEVHYNDIASLEHRTTILWKEAVNSLLLFAGSVLLYYSTNHGELTSQLNQWLRRYFPEIYGLLPAEVLLPAAVVALAVAGAYHLAHFIPSLSGYFRISRKDRAPVVIPTGMTPQLRALIKEIEELMSGKAQEVQAAQMAQKAAPPPGPVRVPIQTPESIRFDIQDTLNVKLREIAENKVVLISSKSENHSQIVSNVLDILVNKRDMGGVYLSVTRPYDFILSTINPLGISSSNIYFIDCISLMAGKAPSQKSENVVFIENPSSLEEVSMYLDKMLIKVQNKKKFLILDSLSSLLIYNTDKSVKEFTHFLINKIRLENVAGIILSIEKKEAEDLVKTLTPMCDAEIKF